MDHRNGLTAKEEEEEEMDREETTNTELIFEVKYERTLNFVIKYCRLSSLLLLINGVK